MRHIAGATGVVVLGLDPGRDETALVAAYNDRAGVTAAFNLNVLARINRDLGGDVALEGFRHDAVWQPGPRRIEMRLVSLVDQRLTIGERAFTFAAGEAIVTEHCYKYAPEDFARMAAAAELAVRRTWTEPRHGMQLHALVAALGAGASLPW